MAKNKTVETQNSVAGFLATIKDQKRRKDCSTIIDLITEHTGIEPRMWGTSIVGFGSYHYKYESGHEGEAPLAGIASRANAITVYLGKFDKEEELLSKLGKHKTGGGCLYIQNLEDIDTRILAKLVKKSIEHRKKLYPG
ncbi:MAG: DUF1801 domain-containing protein [Bacteroidota bacterium]